MTPTFTPSPVYLSLCAEVDQRVAQRPNMEGSAAASGTDGTSCSLLQQQLTPLGLQDPLAANLNPDLRTCPTSSKVGNAAQLSSLIFACNSCISTACSCKERVE